MILWCRIALVCELWWLISPLLFRLQALENIQGDAGGHLAVSWIMDNTFGSKYLVKPWVLETLTFFTETVLVILPEQGYHRDLSWAPLFLHIKLQQQYMLSQIKLYSKCT